MSGSNSGVPLEIMVSNSFFVTAFVFDVGCEFGMLLRCARICATVIFWAFGIYGKNLSSVSLSFNFPSSTSCKIITVVNIFVMEPIRHLLAADKGFFSFPLIWL